MLLSMKNVTICYGDIEAVREVSLELAEGSVVAIIGSNGAGKSTIMRGICGLKPIKKGEIFFYNERIDGLSPQDIAQRGLAHVPEGRRLFPRMTVLENLLLGAYLRNDKKGINENLDQIYQRFPRLKERAKQLAGSLSGGEQQMLSVARALMSKPKLVLMDEPSLGLSPAMVKEISNIIRMMRKMDTSIILVEQNCHMALNLADRGYVLELGKIALEGDAKDLLSNSHVKEAYLGGNTG